MSEARFSKYPGSGIYVPTSTIAQKARVNHIERYEFVMDYAPGRSKHRDPEVVNVNDALRGLNDASPIQKVFAAFLPDTKPFGTVFGLTIWLTEDPSHCFFLGNCANEKVGDKHRGVGDVKRIMHWLSATNMLSDGNKHNAADYMKYFDEHNAQIKKRAQEQIHQMAGAQAQDTLKAIRDQGIPLHSGQTVTWKDPAVEADKKARKEAEAAPTPAPPPAPPPPPQKHKSGKRR